MAFIFCMVIIILQITGCGNRKIINKVEIFPPKSMKPYTDPRLSFSIFNQTKLRKHKQLKDLTRRRAISVIDSLLKDLADNAPDYNDEYYKWYTSYQQLIDYTKLYNAKKSDANSQLSNIRNKLNAGDSGVSFSEIEAYYLYYDCGDIFRKDWVMLPQVYFTKEFYEQVISSSDKDLFFNSYLHDGSDKKMSLPVFSPLSQGREKFTIAPRLIDKDQADVLLKHIKSIHGSTILDSEENLYKTLLTKVALNELALIIHKLDM